MTTTLNASTAGAGGFIATSDNSGVLALQTAGTTAITVDASQNVGIGTSSPASFDATGRKLVVGTGSGDQGMTIYTGTGNSNIFFASGTTGSQAYNGYIQYNQSSNSMLFGVNAGVERMRIDSSGLVLVNRTSASGTSKLQVSGTSGAASAIETFHTATTTQNHIQFNNGSVVGTISTNGSNTSYNTSSDYRLKENITPMTSALAKVAQLKPVTYKWKVDGSDGEGFIAHELAEVCPHAVNGEKDAVDAEGNPQYQGIDVSFLVATLTAALQETKTLIDTQAETINALTARIVALESKP